jgi:hypothetical protein
MTTDRTDIGNTVVSHFLMRSAFFMVLVRVFDGK